MFLSVINIFIEVLFPAFAVIGLSALINRKQKKSPQMLSKLSIYFLFPAFIVYYLSSIEINLEEIGSITIMAIGSAILLLLIGIVLGKALKLPNKIRTSFILCMFYGNVGALGFTIIGFAYGDLGFQKATLFYAVSQFFVNPIAIFIASRGSASIKESFLNIVKNPIIYALFIGLLISVSGISLPQPINLSISLISQAAIPIQLVILGFQLARVNLKKQLGIVFLASSVRLLAAPAIGFALVLVSGIKGLAMQASMMQISMPTGLFVTVYATEFGSDAEFASMVGMVTTIGSIITLSILLSIL